MTVATRVRSAMRSVPMEDAYSFIRHYYQIPAQGSVLIAQPAVNGILWGQHLILRRSQRSLIWLSTATSQPSEKD